MVFFKHPNSAHVVLLNIHSTNECIVSCMQDTVLGTGDTAVNTMEQTLSWCSYSGMQPINKIKKQNIQNEKW